MKASFVLPRFLHTTTSAIKIAGKTDQPLLVTHPTDIPHVFGYCITKSGETLFMQKEQIGIDCERIHFINLHRKEIGFVEFVPSNKVLDFFFVVPSYRGNGYSKDMLIAIIASIKNGNILASRKVDFNIYIKNPFLALTFIRFGFTPTISAIGLKIRAIVSRLPNQNKVILFIKNPEKRRIIEEYIADPQNADWHIFEVSKKAIEGQRVTIFARYDLTNTAVLEKQLDSSSIGIFFY